MVGRISIQDFCCHQQLCHWDDDLKSLMNLKMNLKMNPKMKLLLMMNCFIFFWQRSAPEDGRMVGSRRRTNGRQNINKILSLSWWFKIIYESKDETKDEFKDEIVVDDGKLEMRFLVGCGSFHAVGRHVKISGSMLFCVPGLKYIKVGIRTSPS